jgi:hypothetical protein
MKCVLVAPKFDDATFYSRRIIALARPRDGRGRFVKTTRLIKGMTMPKYCEFCGKVFEVTPSRKDQKYCSVQCRNLAYKGKPSTGRKFTKGQIPWNKGKKGVHPSPATEFKKGNVPWWKKLGFKNLMSIPEVNTKHREQLRKLWKDPQYVAKQMKAHGVKPNRKEKLLDRILQKEFPNEWKYVGDGAFILEGLCPDWVNVNGKKKVIDLFGCFFHGCPVHYPNVKVKDLLREDVRRAIFQKYEYDLLVVWEHELENRNVLIDKLREFTYA